MTDAADTDHCASLVRALDRDRYVADLFAPADKRGALFALHAFNIEVARVREAITNPMAGEVRLQWWSDALIGNARGDVRSNPIAAALLDAVEAHGLPREALFALIDARIFDLYDDPMPSVNDLEGYAGETSSALIRLASLVLGVAPDRASAEAAGHAGVAYAVTGLLRAFPLHAARGQCYVPLDLLKAHGASREDAISGTPTPGLRAALADMRSLARRHHEEAVAALQSVAPEALPAFLPLALVPGDLKAMERRPYDPFREAPAAPPVARLWRLWRAGRTGRL
ncbi:phytoene/squalene synthase family protein [Bosea sp. 117]|uniref:phytoene/squalene synthase family protein n=1 Tax=Bosea sp. 117 TaxID=1125973 RepID=UPI000493B7CE|nr:phytoene/squalene synthase family protein [Bosea sp. 117]